MDRTEFQLRQIRKEEAMRSIGWGSLNRQRTFIDLTIQYYKSLWLFEDMNTFNFRVFQRHQTINGNTSHTIEALHNQIMWQEPSSLQHATLVAEVQGTLTDFTFAMTAGQIKYFWEISDKGSNIKLKAEKVNNTVIVYYMENVEQNSSNRDQIRFKRSDYKRQLSIKRHQYQRLIKV